MFADLVGRIGRYTPFLSRYYGTLAIGSKVPFCLYGGTSKRRRINEPLNTMLVSPEDNLQVGSELYNAMMLTCAHQ